MKTAILISGHMRTFDRCLATQHWHVFRHFPNADFFVSTVADRDAHKAELLRAKHPNAKVHIEAVPFQPELPLPLPPVDPSWTVGRMYSHEPYAISVHPQQVLKQLWQLERCWELFEAKRGDARYDYVIRIRPDLWFKDFELFYPTAPHSAVVPNFGSFGGVNDRFAVLTESAAKPYFTTYSRIPMLIEKGCPLHPESLVRGSLELADVAIHRTVQTFATLRSNGDFRQPEITDCDHLRSWVT